MKCWGWLVKKKAKSTPIGNLSWPSLPSSWKCILNFSLTERPVNSKVLVLRWAIQDHFGLFIPPFVCRMGYIVFVRSVSLFICPSFRPSVNPFYNQVLLKSFLITYNSAATDQKLFIFGMGVPGRVPFLSTSMDPWVLPQCEARGQNLGHPDKVVYCSLFIQTTSY